MATVQEILDRHTVGLSEEDVAAGLDKALRAAALPTAAPLTQVELDYLRRHAGGESETVLAGWDADQERLMRSAAVTHAVEEMIATSLSRAEAARRLQIDASGVSRRISSKRLYAYKVGTRDRIPAWQLVGARALPGLERVVPTIPEGAHPLDVAALMGQPQDELDNRSPVQWLAEGGDPAAVAGLLALLGRW